MGKQLTIEEQAMLEILKQHPAATNQEVQLGTNNETPMSPMRLIGPFDEDRVVWQNTLKQIDWHYEYSDDANVWKRGKAQQEELSSERSEWKREQLAFYKTYRDIGQRCWEKYGCGKNQKEYLSDYIVQLENFIATLPEQLKFLYTPEVIEIKNNVVYKTPQSTIDMVIKALETFITYYNKHPLPSLYKFCSQYSKAYNKHNNDTIGLEYVSADYLAISEELEHQILALHGTIVGHNAQDILQYCIMRLGYHYTPDEQCWINYGHSPIITEHVLKAKLTKRDTPWLVIGKLALFPVR